MQIGKNCIFAILLHFGSKIKYNPPPLPLSKVPVPFSAEFQKGSLSKSEYDRYPFQRIRIRISNDLTSMMRIRTPKIN